MVKGHAEKEGRELTRDKRLTIKAYLLVDMILTDARGAYRAKTNCLCWPVEKSNTVHPGNNINNPYETTTSIPAVRWEVEGLFH
jgi:hypothetical protein